MDIPMSRTSWNADMPVLASYTHCIGSGTDFIPVDSGVLSYTAGESYNVKTKTFQFDSLYGYWFSSSVSQPSTLELQSFDDSNNVINDFVYTRDPLTGKWQDSLKTTYFYDTKNNRLSNTLQAWDAFIGTWENIEKHEYNYDISGNLTMDVYQRWDAGVWKNVHRHIYAYDSRQNLIGDAVQVWYDTSYAFSDSGLTTYTYNSKNHLIGSNYSEFKLVTAGSAYYWYWIFQYQKEYDYDTSTWDLLDVIYELPSYSYTTTVTFNGWMISTFGYYTVDKAHNIIEETDPHYYDYKYTYDSVHNLLSADYVTWVPVGLPPVQPIHTEYYSYNSYHQITKYSYLLYIDSINTWIPQVQDRYYYKQAPKKTSVNNSFTSGSPVLNIYPIPAKSVINIDINYSGPEPLKLSIYDMTGRLFYQWHTDASTSAHNAIPVSQLPDGNYIVNVSDGRQQITKQISIIH